MPLHLAQILEIAVDVADSMPRFSLGVTNCWLFASRVLSCVFTEFPDQCIDPHDATARGLTVSQSHDNFIRQIQAEHLGMVIKFFRYIRYGLSAVFFGFYGWYLGSAWLGGYLSELIALEAFRSQLVRQGISYLSSLVGAGFSELESRSHLRSGQGRRIRVGARDAA